MNLLQKTLQYSLLILTVPILIGHGANIEVPVVANTLDTIFDITEGDDESYNLSISAVASAEPNGAEYWFEVTIDGYRQRKAITSGEYFETKPQLLRDDYNIRFTVNPGTKTVEVGDIWLNQLDTGKKIKIIARNIVIGKNEDMKFGTFKISNEDFRSAQEAVGASMSGYILSGDIYGSLPITATDKLRISRNGTLLFSGAGELPAAFGFDANEGDIIAIQASSTLGTKLGEIWLHYPNGNAVKLSSEVSTNVHGSTKDTPPELTLNHRLERSDNE